MGENKERPNDTSEIDLNDWTLVIKQERSNSATVSTILQSPLKVEANGQNKLNSTSMQLKDTATGPSNLPTEFIQLKTKIKEEPPEVNPDGINLACLKHTDTEHI